MFDMIILLFGWLLDWAYGLITHAAQRSTQMGIHWVFTGTYLGTTNLTCIAVVSVAAWCSPIGMNLPKSPLIILQKWYMTLPANMMFSHCLGRGVPLILMTLTQ